MHSKLGHAIGDICTAGIRPEYDEPLTLTAISTEGGKLSLELNAIRVAPDTVYHVVGGSALGQGTKVLCRSNAVLVHVEPRVGFEPTRPFPLRSAFPN